MMNRGRTTRVAQGVGYYALMSVVTVLAVFPFYWMLVSSFKTENDLFQINPTLLPPSISLEHYERLINGTGFARQFGNSTAVAIITMVLVILISSLAGYALSRYRFTGGNEFAVLMLVGQMFPSVLLSIPIFMMLSNIGLLNSYGGLIIAYTTFALPFCTWMIRAYFATVPIELEEAAQIDGCHRIGAMLRVALPLAAPGIAATAVLGFILAWGDYLFASILLRSEDMKTLSVGLAAFITQWRIDYGVLMAGSVLTAIPNVIFFMLVQKYIIAGLTAGAVKG